MFFKNSAGKMTKINENALNSSIYAEFGTFSRKNNRFTRFLP